MKHLPSPVKFRSDINGLRAWAVIAVLFYHFDIKYFSGGFLGVDIFFVISGYLMTAIILKGVEKKEFLIWKFYLSRARRILPALIVLFLVLFLIGWFILPSTDYSELGSQALFSSFFVSNFFFWQTAGYFGGTAHEKWLLHTWSLSVEWQFYVLYPLLIMLLWKIKEDFKFLLIALTILFISSFLLSIYLTPIMPNPSFYLLPTRGWELLMGGIVFLMSRFYKLEGRAVAVLAIISWILIVGSILLMNKGMAWPGFWAFIPVLATAVLIFINQSSSFMVNNRLFQWLGERSYSLYLWHWPLVVFLYFSGTQDSPLFITVALLLSVLLAHMSYHLVEIPTRKYLSKKQVSLELKLIGFFLFIVVIYSAFISQIPLENRVASSVEMVAQEAQNSNPRRKECAPINFGEASPECLYGKGKLGLVLIGDSHADAVIGAAGEVAEKNNMSVMFLGKHGCPTLEGVNLVRGGGKCSKFNNWVLDRYSKFSEKPPLLIVNSAWVRVGFQKKPKIYFSKKADSHDDVSFQNEFKEALVNLACKFNEINPGNIYVTRPIPAMLKKVPNVLRWNNLIGKPNEDVYLEIEDYMDVNKIVWNAQDEAALKCNINILNPLEFLCENGRCLGSKKGIPYYYDHEHLSERGNRLLEPLFQEIFDLELDLKQP